jgi:hypothetical protein
MGEFLNGLPTDLFVEKPKQKVICPLCFDVYQNPHQCTNGHIFCFKCIETSINAYEECPVCRMQMLGVGDLSRNIFLSDEIDDLIVYCKPHTIADYPLNVDICHWSGPLKQRDTHLNHCSYNHYVNCPVAADCCLGDCLGNHYESYAAVNAHLVDYSMQREAQILDLSAQLQVAKSNRLIGFGFAIQPFLGVGDMPTQENCESIYCGRINENKEKQGQGVWVINSRISYIGCFVANRMHGLGFYDNKDSYTHNGMFENDQRHGQCHMFTTISGRQGNGMFRNDVMHGHGKIWSTVDHFSYSGDFENGNMHGHGKIVFACGEKSFEGIFVDNSINGAGVLTLLVSHETLTGTFVGDLCTGKGEWRNTNGTMVYSGDFKRGKRDGHGTLLTAEDGSTSYTGGFSNNLPHGKGTNKRADGSVFDVIFSKGILQLSKKAKILVDLC